MGEIGQYERLGCLERPCEGPFERFAEVAMQTAGSTFAVGQGPQKSNIRLFTDWILIASNSRGNHLDHSCEMMRQMSVAIIGL